MPEILQKLTFQANNDLDSVVIRVGEMSQRIGYNTGFEIDQNLRMAAKHAAQFHRAPASFWRDVDLVDLDDCPRPHRGYRQSRHLPTYQTWSVTCKPPLVGLVFDGQCVELDYETAVKAGHTIRRASRRAKAWAGDTSRSKRLLAHVTDANAPAVFQV